MPSRTWVTRLTSPPRDPGTAVCQIDGLPQAGFPTCWETQRVVVLHASNPDGAVWTESGVGAATYVPAPGSVEGWKYQSLSDPAKFPPLGPAFGIAAPPVDPPPTSPPATKPPAPAPAARHHRLRRRARRRRHPAPRPPRPRRVRGADGLTPTTSAGLVAPTDATTTSRAEDPSSTTTSAKRALAAADLSSTKDGGGIPIGTIVGGAVVLALAAAAAFVAFRRARTA